MQECPLLLSQLLEFVLGRFGQMNYRMIYIWDLHLLLHTLKYYSEQMKQIKLKKKPHLNI